MTKKTRLLTIAAGLILAVTLASFFITSHNQIPVQINPASITKQIRKQSKKETDFREKVTSINNHEKELVTQLEIAKAELKKAKTKSSAISNRLSLLISKSSINQSSDSNAITTDSEIKIEAVKMLEAQARKDDMQNVVQESMQKQILIKDSLLDLLTQQYSSIKIDFNNSLQGQKILEDEISQYKKLFRRQKLKKGILATGTIILSAIAIKSMLR